MLDFVLVYETDGNIISSSEKSNELYELNIIEASNNFKVLINLKKPLFIKTFMVKIPYTYTNQSKVFVNGYQSWTDTKEFLIKENVKDVYKLPRKLVDAFAFDKYGDATFKRYKKNVLHGYTYSYIKDDKEVFIGSLNEKNSYLIINHDIKSNQIVLESDINTMLSDSFSCLDVVIYNDVKLGYYEYFKYFNNPTAKPIKGYTSWYNYYQNINEELILSNLNNIDNKYYDLFQIDDGFETYVGDWLDIDTAKFPNKLTNIVSKIHEKNMLAGIWLAPFVAEEKSELFKNHKDWFYKDKNGNYAKAGCNWSGFYTLNILMPEVKDYIVNVLNYYIALGFDFFKLDFLYAIGLIETDNKTRAMIQNEGMELLRTTLKDKLILGCGVPLSSAFNNVDYCRIGPDVSLKFDDVWYMKHMHRERISTKVTLQNTLFRHQMTNKVFLNDPDVVILREENNHLNSKQKEALLTINILFGDLYMSSDDTSKYDIKTLDKINELFALKESVVSKEVNRNKNNIDFKLTLNDNNVLYFSYNTRKGELIWKNQK